LLPPANTGLGFLDAVSDAEILLYADPTDANNDGISGVPNYVSLKSYVVERSNSITQNGKYIARFGKKASTYNLLQQTAQAYNQILALLLPMKIKTLTQAPFQIRGLHQTVADVVFYLKTLKAPIPRIETTEILSGSKLFANVGCDKCHRPEMKTGVTEIAALSNKTFFSIQRFVASRYGTRSG